MKAGSNKANSLSNIKIELINIECWLTTTSIILIMNHTNNE